MSLSMCRSARNAVSLVAALCVAAMLSACVTSSPDGTPRPRAPQLTNADGRDLPTASDESDARRRARVRLELASAYFSQGQFTTALDEVKQVIQLDPKFSEAFELRGLIYEALKERGKADESFMRAIALDERNGSALHNYGWALCRRGQFEASEVWFDRSAALPMSVGAPKTLLAKGVCQMSGGRLAEAERTLARSYELDPANPATAYNRALVLHRLRDDERARFYIRRVNAVPEQQSAESLWLAIRIEHRLGGIKARDELSFSLKSRFPSARETNLMEMGRFDE